MIKQLAPLLLAPLLQEAPDLQATAFNEVQMKGAHNSVDRDESLADQLAWFAGAPHQSGCRSIELDIVQDPDCVLPGQAWSFSVQHGGSYSPKAPSLRQCLAEVKRWSDINPKHGVVVILVDVKSGACHGDDGEFPRQIDAILGTLDASSIFRPAQLQLGEETLLAGARERGWPKMSELLEKFIIVLSGEDGTPEVARRRHTYLETLPDERLAFVDVDSRTVGKTLDAPEYTDGKRVFINVHLGSHNWENLVRAGAAQGFVTRTWKANSSGDWDQARALGVNVISTDKVRDHGWAYVDKSNPYRVRPR